MSLSLSVSLPLSVSLSICPPVRPLRDMSLYQLLLVLLSHAAHLWCLPEFLFKRNLMYTVSQKKTVQNCFYQNFVKFPSILITFGR